MNSQTFWTIKKTGHPKFPFRLIVSRGGEKLLDLFVQDRWPGAKGNIFCLWAAGREDMSFSEEEIERVPVLNYRMFGKRLTIILDRPKQKRCSFLFLTKGYKSKEGEYEQIFWQTQQGLSQRRTKYKFTYYKKEELTVFIDSAERYPWNFPAAKTVREKLPVGDYAIKDKFGILAAIERKTLANLMGEFGNLKKFHQHLSELETLKNSVLIVEAPYIDFLNGEKIKPYTGNFAAKAIAEIQALHPDLPIIFAGSRKAAIVWTRNFFETILSKSRDLSSNVLRESTAKYGDSKNAVSSEDEVRRIIFSQMPECFSARMLMNLAPRASYADTRRILKKLQNEGVLSAQKEGRKIIYVHRA